MADGQMLKKLPEECLLNISSYLLGTPQQLKIKQSNTFKQIQKKFKFDEIKLTATVSFKQGTYFIDDPEETYKIEDYGYITRNKNYSIEKTLLIMKGQCDRLLDMARPYGSTHLWLVFYYYDEDEDDEDNFLQLRIGDLDYLDTEDVLDKMDKWIMKWSNTLNGLIRFKSIQFFFKNKDIHYDD